MSRPILTMQPTDRCDLSIGTSFALGSFQLAPFQNFSHKNFSGLVKGDVFYGIVRVSNEGQRRNTCRIESKPRQPVRFGRGAAEGANVDPFMLQQTCGVATGLIGHEYLKIMILSKFL